MDEQRHHGSRSYYSSPGAAPCAQMMGPVDVEDLASYFTSASCVQQSAPPPAYYPNPVEEAAFAYCTDNRWMACPATSYCPLYDVRPLESWQSLPCAQDFYGYYVQQPHDEELLEEYLSNEKRKEKSRDAARCRRSRETDIFTELAAAVPVTASEAAHLDKASVMRLAIAYLKTRTLMDSVPKPTTKPEISPEMDDLFLKALDGFVMVLDNNGDMAYLSPNVRDYLGIAQMDLMGQNVFDYSHPCDHDEIRESLSIKASEISEDHPCNFFLRLKCTLTSKGRKVNIKSASYKVIHCTGRLIAHVKNDSIKVDKNESDSENQEETVEKEPGVSLVVVASPVPHPSNIETPLGKYTFLSKHSLNMKFTYADDKLAEFLGWESNDLVGQSVFDFHHALDNLSLDKSFKSLFHKGQCETLAYRFLNKNGGYAWVVTQATLIHCNRLQKPLSVVCVNYLLSGVENEDEVYSVRQLEAREASKVVNEQQTEIKEQTRKPLADKPVFVTSSLFRQQPADAPKPQLVVNPVPRICEKENDKKYIKVEAPAEPKIQEQAFAEPPPQAATASIFAPRTKDMNKGFLTFCEDQPGLTMLKDEPEDLTHLAPVAGDVCVPLEDPPFLSDMLDDILNSSYCPELLTPELNIECTNNDSNGHQTNVLQSTPVELADPLRLSSDECNSLSDDAGDPFIYRDSPSRCSLGTDLHSPTLTKSPDGSGMYDSLSSPNGSGGGLSDDEILMLSVSDMVDDDVMTLRAPFIPMSSDQDEALQLLISDDMVMWGPNSDKKTKWLVDVEEENANSSLAQLLSNDAGFKKLKMDQNALVNPAQVQPISLKNTSKDLITADRGNKRMHAYAGSKASANSKRFKQASGFEPSVEPGYVQSSQLLQQLVSQQVPKARNWSTEQLADSKNRLINGNAAFKDSSLSRLDDDGGGVLRTDDGGGRTQQQQQQSNSVLMNLLVSGCDMLKFENQINDPMGVLTAQNMLQSQQQQQLQQPQPQLIQNNFPPVQIREDEQLQTVPQWNNSNEVFSNNQYIQNKQEPALPALNYEPVTYENDFDFMDTGNIFPDSNELLQVFESNIVA